MITQKSLQLDQTTTIAYQYQQVGENTPWVVLLHGFGGSSNAWLQIIEGLDSNVIAIDFRGHGLSTRSQTDGYYQIANFVTDIHTALNRLQITSCTLVGHCFGGMIGLDLVKQYFHLFSQLILINSADHLPSLISAIPIPDSFQKVAHLIGQHLPDIGLHGYEDYAKYVDSMDLSPTRIASDITHTHLHAYFATLEAILGHDFSNGVESVDLPVTLIAGTHDHIIPSRLSQNLSQRLPNTTYHKIDTGHIAPISRPQKVLGIIKPLIA